MTRSLLCFKQRTGDWEEWVIMFKLTKMRNAEQPFAWSEDSVVVFWESESRAIPHLKKNTRGKADSGFRKKMGCVTHVIILTLPRTVLVAHLEYWKDTFGFSICNLKDAFCSLRQWGINHVWVLKFCFVKE